MQVVNITTGASLFHYIKMDSCSVVYSCDSVNHYGESLVPTAPILCDFDIRFAGNIFKLTKKGHKE